jgi:hypothetical protein
VQQRWAVWALGASPGTWNRLPLHHITYPLCIPARRPYADHISNKILLSALRRLPARRTPRLRARRVAPRLSRPHHLPRPSRRHYWPGQLQVCSLRPSADGRGVDWSRLAKRFLRPSWRAAGCEPARHGHHYWRCDAMRCDGMRCCRSVSIIKHRTLTTATWRSIVGTAARSKPLQRCRASSLSNRSLPAKACTADAIFSIGLALPPLFKAPQASLSVWRCSWCDFVPPGCIQLTPSDPAPTSPVRRERGVR